MLVVRQTESLDEWYQRISQNHLFVPKINLQTSVTEEEDEEIYVSERHHTEGSDRNIRVFISSTFKDMSEERELLVKQVFPELRSFCAERSVCITEIDLRWGITSEDTNQGNTINICLNEVENCKPYFLCMLGSRYGWAKNTGKEDKLLDDTFKNAESQFGWISNFKDRSITELEIRAGVLNNLKEKSNSIFAFKNTYINQESEENTKKLKNLKNEISKQGFKNYEYNEKPDSNFVNYITNELKKYIEIDFPKSKTISNLEKEKLLHDGFQEIRARVYIGRQMYFDKLDNFVENISIDEPLTVLGKSGSGKSAFIANWVVRYKEKNPKKFIIAHYIGSTSVSSDLGSMIKRIISEIKNYYSIDDEEIPNDYNELISQFSNWLDKASQRGGVIIVLDALNQLENINNALYLKWLPLKLPKNVKIIISTLPGICLNEIQKRNYDIIEITPLKIKERIFLINKFMTQFSKNLTENQIKKIAFSNQSESPLFLRAILEELRVFGVFEEIDSKIDYYLSAKTVPDLFVLIFQRFENEFENQNNIGLIGNILSLIYISRKGLSEKELLDILNINQATWSPIFLNFKEILINKSGLFNFYHDYLRQAVKNYYLSENNSEILYSFINYFEYVNPKDIRVCEELPFQYEKLGNFEKLSEIISNIQIFTIMFENQKYDLFLYFRKLKENGINIENKILQNFLNLSENCLLNPSIESNEINLQKILNVSKFFEEIGSYDYSEKINISALDLSLKIFSENHQKTGEIKAQLAYLYRLMGKYQDSEILYSSALKIFESVNVDDFLIAKTANNFAVCLRYQAKYDEAEPWYYKSLNLREKIGNKIELAESLNSLGCLYQDKGDLNKAEEMFKKGLDLRINLLGELHVDVATSWSNIAGLLCERSQYDEALNIYQKSLNIVTQIFGSINPNVAQILNCIAGVYQTKSDFENSVILNLDCIWSQILINFYEKQKLEKYYLNAINLCEKCLSEDHPDVATNMNDLALVYARQDKFDLAEPMYLKCLQMREKILGKDHPNVAQTLLGLASLYQDQFKLDIALETFEKAKNMTASKFGENHPDTALALLGIAAVSQLMAKFQDAEMIYEKVLNIYISTFGEISHDVARTKNDMAVLYFNQKNYSKAEKMYLEALSLFEKIFGKSNFEIAESCFNIAEFYHEISREKDSLKFKQRANQILKDENIDRESFLKKRMI